MNTAVAVQELSSKYLALDHLGASENDVMSTIDKSRWDIILIFSKGDVSKDDIDKAKASRKTAVSLLSDERWHQHFNWAWRMGADPSSIVLEDDVETAIQRELSKLREKYPRIDLVMLGKAAFDKWQPQSDSSLSTGLSVCVSHAPVE